MNFQKISVKNMNYVPLKPQFFVITFFLTIPALRYRVFHNRREKPPKGCVSLIINQISVAKFQLEKGRRISGICTSPQNDK